MWIQLAPFISTGLANMIKHDIYWELKFCGPFLEMGQVSESTFHMFII